MAEELNDSDQPEESARGKGEQEDEESAEREKWRFWLAQGRNKDLQYQSWKARKNCVTLKKIDWVKKQTVRNT